MKTIGDKIKTMRKQVGLTQKELGDILHVSYQAVSKWERNLGLPDTSLFPDIAKALNTTVNSLFYENGEIPVEFHERSDVNASFETAGADENRQKSAYKPVKRNFLIITAVVFVALVLTISLTIVGFDRQKALKSQLSTAFYVFLQEDNVEVTANYNDETYMFARKYFFDGRVLMRYSEKTFANYFYEETIYSIQDGKVEAEKISSDDYLSGLKNIYSLSLDIEGVEKVESIENEYKIKLKNADNLPIARLFGFSAKADVRIFLRSGKINGIVITEGDNKLSLSYRFGYDFQVDLPDYINP